MTKRRTTREIVEERTYPISIYDLPDMTYKCRYCGRPVTLLQLESDEAIEVRLQRFEGSLPLPITYGYKYYHRKCEESYRRRGVERYRSRTLERLREEYRSEE